MCNIRVRIKRIAIAKCDLFFHYRDATKNLILLFSRYRTLCKHKKNAREFHLYCWNHVCKVSEWCLVDFFHCEVKVSTQILVHDICIAKYKKFSAYGGVPMALWAIFFVMQDIYVNSMPEYWS